MDYRHIDLELKAEGEEGIIEGYGSVFDVVDSGGDIVAAGAFRKSLKTGRRPKMLYQHDPSDVIGVWDEVREDGAGLRVRGKLLTGIDGGRKAWELVKAGAIDGLSIGYRTMSDKIKDGRRVITEAALYEVSLVTFPMNEMARIDAVKAAQMTRRELERVLTQDAGLSRDVARRLMAGGVAAITTKQDAGETLAELAAFMRHQATL